MNFFTPPNSPRNTYDLPNQMKVYLKAKRREHNKPFVQRDLYRSLLTIVPPNQKKLYRDAKNAKKHFVQTTNIHSI